MSTPAERRNPDPAEQFGSAALERAFAHAVMRAGGVYERTFVMAGRNVRFRFAGRALLGLCEAFEHLAEPFDGEPSLVVHLWDEASTGVAAPEPPYEGRIGEPAGLRVLWHADGVRVVLQPGQRTINAFDETTGNAWFWCADPAGLPFWEAPAPIRMVLHWWLGTQGALLLHAAAVGFRSGGALIVGVGGSGKSTTALLSLRHGLRYASDDYVAVDPKPADDGSPTVHSLFGSGKLTAAQYDAFPDLHAGVVNADKLDTEKAVVFVGRVAPDQLVRSFPLRAVLVPRITGRAETTSRRISPIAALAGLAPSTIFQLPGTPSSDLSAMAAVVRAVPTFALELGSDLPGVPAEIVNILSSLGIDDS